ncbi:MAG: HD domain-containing phosphohydrolase [Phycisphaerae bacterium]
MTEAVTNRMTPVGAEGRTSEVYRAALMAVAGLVETRDPQAGDHLGRIQAYCRLMIEQLNGRGRTTALSDTVVAASILHDIGKAVIPDRILLKPGRLTVREFRYVRRHTSEGRRVISRIIRRLGPHPFLLAARDIAYGHHERWDGTGYPRGLAGDRIPLAARVVAVADVFDALVSRRCYKPPIPVREALQAIEDGARSHFDPDVVAAFHQSRDAIAEVAAGCPA